MSSAPFRVAVLALVLSATGFVAVLGREGYSDHAIIPVPGDRPTIGFGETEGVKIGDRITPPAAVARALSSMSRYEGAIKRCVHVPLAQYEYDAYVSFTYNVGGANFCGSTLVKKLNTGDYAGACAELSRWTRGPGGVVYQGLVNRRADERARCEGRK